MPIPKSRRLPFEPLLAASGAETLGQLERIITAGAQAIYRWKNHGGIPLFSADRAAAELGLHPMSIWGDEWLANA